MASIGITSFLLSFKFEAGRSYLVHCRQLHYSVHLKIVTNLDHKIVAYFDPGLQNVLVQFLIVGTHGLSHMCTFLECHRKNY